MTSHPPGILPRVATLPDTNSLHIEASRLQDESGVPEHIDARQQLRSLFERVDGACPSLMDMYFKNKEDVGEQGSNTRLTGQIGNFLLEASRPGPLRDSVDLAIVNDAGNSDDGSRNEAQFKANAFLDQERRVQMAFRAHKNRFPTQIWHCCSQLCFTTIATDSVQCMVFDELLLMHEYAEVCHAAADNIPVMIGRRRRGIGTSTIGFVAPSREEREASDTASHGTARENALRKFGKFVIEVLPFLYGQVDSPRGTTRPKKKLCTQAICCLLGVSRNFLYNRKCTPNPANVT